MANPAFVFVLAMVVGSNPLPTRMSPHLIQGDRAACEQTAKDAVANKEEVAQTLGMLRAALNQPDLNFKLYCVPQDEFKAAAAKAKSPQDFEPAREILTEKNRVKVDLSKLQMPTPKVSVTKAPAAPEEDKDYTKDWK